MADLNYQLDDEDERSIPWALNINFIGNGSRLVPISGRPGRRVPRTRIPDIKSGTMIAGPIDIPDDARVAQAHDVSVQAEVNVHEIGVHGNDEYRFRCWLVPLPDFEPSNVLTSVLKKDLPPFT